MLRGLLAGVALTLAAAGLGAYALIEAGTIAANADAEPGSLEVWMARTSLSATLRHEAPVQPNPVALSDEHLLAGMKLFARNCAICHGDSRGKAAASPIAKGLYQHPPQLATDGVEDDPEGESFWKIKHGIRLTGMPSFKGTLSDEEIWSLALFLKHMDHLPPTVREAWQRVRNWPDAST